MKRLSRLALSLVPAALALTALATTAGPARAGESFAELEAKGAQAMLEAADKLMNHYPTQLWTFKMTVKPGSGEPKTLRFKVWQKGGKQRLVRFLDPGEVKGMSILTSGASVMYVYSPQTDNVRRVASHAKRQTLLGSNLTYSDMSTEDLSTLYDASFGEKTDDALWLELKKKPDADVTWDKLRVKVSRKTTLPEVIEYWDGGKRVRTQERSRYEVMDGVPTYRLVTMRDEGKDPLVTTLEMESQEVGLPLEDSLFQKKNLVRGE